jgi:hypothetical protein
MHSRLGGPVSSPLEIDGREYAHPGGYLVVPILSAGLGNRLRLMASALQVGHDTRARVTSPSRLRETSDVVVGSLTFPRPAVIGPQMAQDSGRVCLLAWFPSNSCNARFEDLFEGVPPGAGLELLADLNGGFARAMGDLYLSEAPEGGYGNLTIPVVDVRGNDAAPLPPGVGHAPVVMLRAITGIYFKQRGQPCGEYYSRKSALYRSLVPNPEVARLADAIAARHLSDEGRTYVGVHIRSVFLEHDVREVDFAGERFYYNESAAPSGFFRVMHAMDVSPQRPPGLRFVVASNSPAIYDQARQEFPPEALVTIQVRRAMEETDDAEKSH